MLKKFLISILLFTTLFTSVLAKPALAQSEPKWYTSGFKDWYLKVADPTNGEDIFAERYTSAQVEWVYWGIVAFMLNNALGPDLAYCLISESGGLLTTPIGLFNCRDLIDESIQQGLDLLAVNENSNSPQLANTNSGFSRVFLDSRPISGIGYLREKVGDFRVVKPVMAQGFGFGAAEPIQQLWTAARNITYFFMVVAIVVVAFMVMFRIKNSPQTVITIQSVLPRIIVGIVLVTFSYAIAGLMIDLMYVVIGVLASVLSQSGLFTAPNDTWEGMYADLSGSQLGSGLIGMFFGYYKFFLISFFANNALLVGALMLSGIGGALLFAIIIITLLIIALKTMWALLKNFVTILLLIAGAPFMILSGVVGGAGFGGWLKTLAAHLAVYPAVGTLFALSFFFLGNSFPDTAIVGALWNLMGNLMPFDPKPDVLTGSQWVPPFAVIGSNLNLVWLSISLIILSLIPKTVEIIQSVVAGKPFAYGSAIGAPLAAGFGAATFPLSYGANVLNQGVEAKVKETFSRIAKEAVRSIQGGR